MPKPTESEIQAEIAALKGQENRVRRFSMFGEDNRAKIRAQVLVLENDYDDDDIYGLMTEEALNCALDARNWLDGDSEDGTPSSQWEPLCAK